MIIDAAGERSEQGRFLSKSPGSSNAVLGGGRGRVFRRRASLQNAPGNETAGTHSHLTNPPNLNYLSEVGILHQAVVESCHGVVAVAKSA